VTPNHHYPLLIKSYLNNL